MYHHNCICWWISVEISMWPLNEQTHQCLHGQNLCTMYFCYDDHFLFIFHVHSHLLELSCSPRQWPPRGPPDHRSRSPQPPLPLFPPQDQFHRITPSSTAVLRLRATPLPLPCTHLIRRRTPTKWWQLRQTTSLWGASWARGSLDQF